MRHPIRFLILSTLVSMIPHLAFGQFIDIRVSIKIIVHPTTGARPMNITDNLFYDAAGNANQWQAGYYRGYRFRVTEIVEIGGPSQGGADGPSKWFGIDVRGTNWSSFQLNVNSDSRYQRRTDQVNFYVTTGPSSNPGGACPIPPKESGLTACHGFVNDGPWWMNHELGHFFGLSHTHGASNPDDCNTGDDGIPDTLPDNRCWTTRDLMAIGTYFLPYASLSVGDQTAVDNTYYNVMSYHEAATKDTVENRMTELQLDRFADTANTSRNAFVSGRTWFIRPGGRGLQIGLSTQEFPNLDAAASFVSSGGGDLILLRPGNYPDHVTLSKPVTLRASRSGAALLGVR